MPLRQSFAAIALFLSGCLCHTTHCVRPEVAEACHDCPGACRNQVYVVLLHGFDPFDCGGLTALRDTVNSLGFGKTYYGQAYHVGDFAKEIVEHHEREPGAKFVVVGCGLGVEAAFELTERVAGCGIEIATLVGIDAPLWTAAMHPQPANVGRLVYLRKQGAPDLGLVANGEIFEVPTELFAALAAQPAVYEGLLDELKALADQLPKPTVKRSELAFADPMPSPRGAVVERGPSDAWDFLRPVAKLAAPGGAPATAWTALKPVAP